jgi:hypothetical protein
MEDSPKLSEPLGGLPSDIDYDIAYFYIHLASLLQTDLFLFLNKFRVYLRFLRLRKNYPYPKSEKYPSLCTALHSATPAELEIELFSMLNDISDKELVIPILKEAILIARSDNRFYIPEKEVLEKLLLEKALLDEALEQRQKDRVQSALSSFSELYSTLLQEMISWNMSQTAPKSIRHSLLLSSGFLTLFDSFPGDEKEALNFYLKALSFFVAAGNMLKEDWMAQKSREALPPTNLEIFKNIPSAKTTLSKTVLFLYFLTKSSSVLSFNEEEIASFLSKSPGILAQALLLFPFEELQDKTAFIEIASLTSHFSHFFSIFIESYLFQKRDSELLQKNYNIPINLLIGFCQVWKNAYPSSEKEALLALITLIGYDALTHCLLHNPSLIPQQYPLWSARQLPLLQFLEALFGHPLEDPVWDSFSLTTWPKEPCIVPEEIPLQENKILALLTTLSTHSFWPELDLLLKKTLKVLHIKTQLDQQELDRIIDTCDKLFEAIAPEKQTPSLLQLVFESTKQARMLSIYFKKAFCTLDNKEE